MKILITGSAGFIGSALSIKLLDRGDNVVGIDNHNDYYDPLLKEARLARHKDHKNYIHLRCDIEDSEVLNSLFKKHQFDVVVNLAAQAGVRYSIENPQSYINTNIVGFGNILESCRNYNISHLVYASSSSVYGSNTNMPFSSHDSADHPLSLYAASKKANELMAHSYSHLYNIPTTGLRFFTVYGPWGRPDMALFLFTKAMLNGERIKLFNYGDMVRDFTYVDDIVNSIFRLISKPAKKSSSWDSKNPNPSNSSGPFSIFNIGNSSPTKLVDFVETLEEKLQLKAKVNLMEIQPGDVSKTFADNNKLFEYIDFIPKTTVKQGISDFVDWYKSYYKI